MPNLGFHKVWNSMFRMLVKYVENNGHAPSCRMNAKLFYWTKQQINSRMKQSDIFKYLDNRKLWDDFINRHGKLFKDMQTQHLVVNDWTTPAVQPVVQPAVQPVVQPVVKPAAKPSVQPVVQPAAKPSVQPVVQPAAKPAVQPVVKPVVQPVVQPAVQPVVQPSPVQYPARFTTVSRKSSLGQNRLQIPVLPQQYDLISAEINKWMAKMSIFREHVMENKTSMFLQHNLRWVHGQTYLFERKTGIMQHAKVYRCWNAFYTKYNISFALSQLLEKIISNCHGFIEDPQLNTDKKHQTYLWMVAIMHCHANDQLCTILRALWEQFTLNHYKYIRQLIIDNIQVDECVTIGNCFVISRL